MTEKNIKAVIIDLDGVVRFFPEKRDFEIEDKYSLPRGSLCKCAFSSNYFRQAITGKITDEQWRNSIVMKLHDEYSVNDPGIIVKEWSDFSGKIDRGVLSKIEEVRKSIPVVLMTNATDRLETDLCSLGVLAKFDHVINSSQVGYAKPDKEIFNHALEYLSLKPKEICFVDDSMVIIERALELGFIAYQYKVEDNFLFTSILDM